ncbi:MAG: cupin domain-containing protein [Chloroflexi bacterium]|nr:cupin domain-containing protein [Chloroflexota bacterium]
MSIGTCHYALAHDEGEAVWFLGALATIKAGRTQTGNAAFAVVEFTLPPGFAPPPHIHHMEDEAFFILEGSATGTCGDEQWEAEPGSFIWLPRGVAHGFKVGTDGPLKVFQITAPAGFDEFVKEVGEPAPSRTLPVQSPPDIEKLNAAAAKVGIEHLGPPPD